MEADKASGLSSSIRGAVGTTSNEGCKLCFLPLITAICQDAMRKQNTANDGPAQNVPVIVLFDLWLWPTFVDVSAAKCMREMDGRVSSALFL